MYARMLEFTVKPERKAELIHLIRAEIIPGLNEQPGFVDALLLEGDFALGRIIAISLWHSKADAERLMLQFYPKIKEWTAPCLASPIVMRLYNVNTEVSSGMFSEMAC